MIQNFSLQNELFSVEKKKRLQGIHDYNLRVLYDSQRLGIGFAVTVLFVFAILGNGVSLYVNIRRSVAYTYPNITQIHKRIVNLEFSINKKKTTQKYSTYLSHVSYFTGM